ncbi:hypothetical protein PHLCEN_2v6838 [Hermanssonia centrifuga]|uniref:Uncharacterized protein n=1 Tax=Hermanssonia centrifuga TaxID=98765 RepID=A0A2R6NYA7_9APHY|nr:hypothetical protein PHLCEN_2v6838 [Hermanssonia centrifuga]
MYGLYSVRLLPSALHWCVHLRLIMIEGTTESNVSWMLDILVGLIRFAQETLVRWAEA